MISADHQQERQDIEKWIVGFTDGEGCFSVSFIKNKTTKHGWQIFPEFVITQSGKSLPALKIFQTYFGCGNIFINRRHDNHREPIYRYCVRSVKELQERIVPFFLQNPMKTQKQKDFKIFARVVLLIRMKKHLETRGAIRIARLVQQMNRRKPSRYLESSETKRQTPTLRRRR